MRFFKSVGAVLAAAAFSIAALSSANATVVAYGQPGFPNVAVSSNSFSQAYYSSVSNVDVGNQSPSNVQAVLESWFGQSLSFVGGGSCGSGGSYSNNCTSYDNGGGNSNKGGVSNLTAQLFAVHFGNRFIAFLFPAAVSGFQIDCLRFGVSNIYAFNGTPEVPVPGAVWLMGSALAGLGFAKRRKKIA